MTGKEIADETMAKKSAKVSEAAAAALVAAAKKGEMSYRSLA